MIHKRKKEKTSESSMLLPDNEPDESRGKEEWIEKWLVKRMLNPADKRGQRNEPKVKRILFH